MTPVRIAIDVGGTFTDCLAELGDGSRVTHKLLSSGLTRGVITSIAGASIVDPDRDEGPDDFWRGATLRVLDRDGGVAATYTIVSSGSAGRLDLDRRLEGGEGALASYEIDAHEPAPILGIRRLLQVRLDAPLPPVRVRLGTTRGTNALLTRRGARTAFVTTRGFGDVLLIATQARPRLFDLTIRKPPPLFERVVEIDERVSAEGEVLLAPDPRAIEAALRPLREEGIVALAIVLMHAYRRPDHERVVAAVARDLGFSEVRISSEVAPLEKIVWRGDTTVMDAYLSPVLRDYVATLAEELRGGRLDLMTSAGGLVGAERFTGKDSILSGPAGGVIGVARVAEAAGITRAIGFDMGGTSTDVSRFDGKSEIEFETEKAGVRIVAPMLAIETVAAGGGSICSFDGVRLVVGPDSAGADPGPACYGKGGPLTVTDLNVLLGRIPARRFPFPLDRDAAERRLVALADEVAASSFGRRMRQDELAEGLLAINAAHVVRAIRAISSAKGYDPRSYALVSFGGAGAQHACAVARELGIDRIVCHPLAGVLSAYGIHLADVRRYGQKSVLRPYSEETIAALDATFVALEEAARAEVSAESVADSAVGAPLRLLDLRYEGVDAIITVPRPERGTFAEAYAASHQALYGYVHEGRAIEIVAARVEVVGRVASPAPKAESAAEASTEPPRPIERASGRFFGRVFDTPIYLREHLEAGASLQGPAIVIEPSSTIVIEPDWNARVSDGGDLVLEAAPDRAATPIERGKSDAPDPIALELLNSRFGSIAEQMGIVLQRTASSTNVKERLDFSCALFTAEGDLVVNAPHIPVHLGAMSETVQRLREDTAAFFPGDVFVTNDPYRGGSHLPDITVITPVFAASGDRRAPAFFVASRAHHAEIGGKVPGSMPPFSRSLADEGVLIRAFKLVDRGRSRETELAAILSSGPFPSRRVADNLADLRAQVAANQAGAALLDGLVADASLPVVTAYMGHLQRAASQKMRGALRAIAGRPPCTFTDHLDDGTPIVVTIAIFGERATIDFTGTGPVSASNLNANTAITTAAVLYVFRCLLDEDVPLCSGVLEPLTIIIPEESILRPPERDDPRDAAAVVGGNVETSQRVVDVLLGALGLAAASQGTMNNLTFGDSTFGYYETIGGGSGATAKGQGADAVHTHMTNTRMTDPEVLERRYPVRLRRFAIRRGSGGAGERRGGDGIVREIELLRPLHVAILSERRGPYAPTGLEGGESGALGENWLLRHGCNTPERLGARAAFDGEAGDRLIVLTPGGGGFGRGS